MLSTLRGGTTEGAGQAAKAGTASALAAQCWIGDVDIAGSGDGAHAIAELALLDAGALASLADANLMMVVVSISASVSPPTHLSEHLHTPLVGHNGASKANHAPENDGCRQNTVDHVVHGRAIGYVQQCHALHSYVCANLFSFARGLRQLELQHVGHLLQRHLLVLDHLRGWCDTATTVLLSTHLCQGFKLCPQKLHFALAVVDAPIGAFLWRMLA